jgi:hypothetical protein
MLEDSYSEQTRRLRHTLHCLEGFMRDVQANTERELPIVFTDAYDVHLAALHVEKDDFPALAVPAWTAFCQRYASATDPEAILSDNEEIVDAVMLVEEVRQVVETETYKHQDTDRTTKLARSRNGWW